MQSFDRLYSDLNTLSKSVVYTNLSSASLHIGLSQPQLSRIVRKIEDELKVVLLERGSKRKSAWTPIAIKLAETFLKYSKDFSRSIEQLVSPSQTRQIKIGTLEGLADLALFLSNQIFKNLGLEQIELNIYDLDELEELFLKGHYDLIFTSRTPNRQKYHYELLMGYQTLNDVSTGKETHVLSPFEFHTQKKSNARVKGQPLKSKTKYFISNSLEARKKWLSEYKGFGKIPSEIKKTATHSIPVLLLGAETLSQPLWDQIIKHLPR